MARDAIRIAERAGRTGPVNPVPAANARLSGPPLRFNIPNRMGDLEQARQRVVEYLRPHVPGRRAVFAVELILEETLTNVIKYGFDDATGHAIDLTVIVQGDEILLRFEDDGMAFDPTRSPDPVPPPSLDRAVPGGLGIMLVRRFSRSIAYQRASDRNVLTISIALA